MCFSSTCSPAVSLRRTAWKRHTVPGRGGVCGEGQWEKGTRDAVSLLKSERDGKGECLSGGVKV